MTIQTCELAQHTLLCQGPRHFAQNATLGYVETNLADHSEFYAIYWNHQTEQIESYLDHRTDTGICHAGTTPDASAHYADLARFWLEDKVTDLFIARDRQPGVGKHVRSTTTRGKNLDLTGTISHTFTRKSLDRRSTVTLAVVEGTRRSGVLPLDKLVVTTPVDVEDCRFEAEGHLMGKTARQLADIFMSLDRDMARYRAL